MPGKAGQGWLGRLLRVLLPLGISAVAIWLVLRSIDLSALLAAFQSIRLSTLIWSCLIFIVGLLLRVWSWHLILRKQFPFKRVFFVMNAGYLLNNVFPFRLGEVGRVILLGSHEEGKPGILEVLSSIMVERIFDIFLASAFFLSMLPLVLVEGQARWLALILLGLAVLALGALIAMTHFREKIVGWLKGFQGRRAWVANWVAPKLDAILKGFSVLNDPKLFLASFGLLFFSWVLSMAQHTLLRLELMPQGELWWVVFVLAAGAFGGALPSAPAGLGVFEAAIVGAFLLLGVDGSSALAYALIIHAIQFSFSSLFGMIGLIKEGQSVGELYRKAIQRKQATKEVVP